MNSVLKSFQYLEHFFPADFIAALTEESFLYRLLVDKKPRANILRQNVDDCLELAYRYDLVDADLEGKLKKGDWESWQAAINELKVAKYLEDIFGVNSLRWHPQGRKGRVGEFEIVLGNVDKPIFVEIKTVFPRELERLERHITEKLCCYAEQVPVPFFLNVHIKEVGTSESFSGKKFKDFLRKELTKISAKDEKGEPLKLPDYRDNVTGLHLEIETIPVSLKPSQKTCHIGIIGGEARWLENKEYLEHSLRKAYEQLPKRGQPCLVILCSSTAFPLDEDDMVDVLLGTLALHFYRLGSEPVTEPKPFRKLDGFPHPNQNRNLSAIGLYREKFMQTNVEKKLEIYHNPFAANPLNGSIFKGKGVRQLVKISETEMGWID